MKYFLFLFAFLPFSGMSQNLNYACDTLNYANDTLNLAGTYIINDTNAVRAVMISYLIQKCLDDKVATCEEIADCVEWHKSQVNFVSINESVLVLYNPFYGYYAALLDGDCGNDRGWERQVPYSIVKSYLSRD